MLPSPHVCCKCKRVVVHTDCLPAVCYACLDEELVKTAKVKMNRWADLITPPDLQADIPIIHEG